MKKRELSVCPVTKSLDVIGDKWTLIIIRDLFAGKSLYKDFMNSPEGISTNILAARLKHLEKMKIIKTTMQHENSKWMTYHLTETGKDLYYVLDAVADWGLKHIEGTRKIIPA